MEFIVDESPCISCGRIVHNLFLVEGICPKCMADYKSSARHIGFFAALYSDICRYLQFYMLNEKKDYKNFISDRNLEHRFAKFVIDTFIDGYGKFPLKVGQETYNTINELFKDYDESPFYGLKTEDEIIEDRLIQELLDSLDEIPPED